MAPPGQKDEDGERQAQPREKIAPARVEGLFEKGRELYGLAQARESIAFYQLASYAFRAGLRTPQ